MNEDNYTVRALKSLEQILEEFDVTQDTVYDYCLNNGKKRWYINRDMIKLFGRSHKIKKINDRDYTHALLSDDDDVWWLNEL